MSAEVTRFLDHGAVEIRRVESGAIWRGVRMPGADLSDLPVDVRSKIETHWSDAGVQAAWAAHMAQVDEETAIMEAERETEEFGRLQRLDDVREGRAQPTTLEEVIARTVIVESKLVAAETRLAGLENARVPEVESRVDALEKAREEDKDGSLHL